MAGNHGSCLMSGARVFLGCLECKSARQSCWTAQKGPEIELESVKQLLCDRLNIFRYNWFSISALESYSVTNVII